MKTSRKSFLNLFASIARHIRPDFLFPVFLFDLLDFPLKIEYLRNPKFATFFREKCRFGPVAQLGERTVRIREVRGFDPLQVHHMDIGRTPIISKAALLYWCGSDVKTKDGCQRLNAIDSRPFLLFYYKYYFGSSSFFCALSKNLGNTFIRRWPKGIIIFLSIFSIFSPLSTLYHVL